MLSSVLVCSSWPCGGGGGRPFSSFVRVLFFFFHGPFLFFLRFACLPVSVRQQRQNASHTSTTGNATAEVCATTAVGHHPHPHPHPQGRAPSCHGSRGNNKAFNISSAIIDAANALAFAASSSLPLHPPHSHPRVDGGVLLHHQGAAGGGVEPVVLLQRQHADDDIGAAAALLLAAGSIGKGRASLPQSPVVILHDAFPAQEQTVTNPAPGKTSRSPGNGNHQAHAASCNRAGAAVSSSSTGANPASVQHGVNLCTFPLVSGGAQEFLVEEAGGNVKISVAGFEAAMLRYGELLRSG